MTLQHRVAHRFQAAEAGKVIVETLLSGSAVLDSIEDWYKRFQGLFQHADRKGLAKGEVWAWMFLDWSGKAWDREWNNLRDAQWALEKLEQSLPANPASWLNPLLEHLHRQTATAGNDKTTLEYAFDKPLFRDHPERGRSQLVYNEGPMLEWSKYFQKWLQDTREEVARAIAKFKRY